MNDEWGKLPIPISPHQGIYISILREKISPPRVEKIFSTLGDGTKGRKDLFHPWCQLGTGIFYPWWSLVSFRSQYGNEYFLNLPNKVLCIHRGQRAVKMWFCADHKLNPNIPKTKFMINAAKRNRQNPIRLRKLFDRWLWQPIVLQPIDLEENTVPLWKALSFIF